MAEFDEQRFEEKYVHYFEELETAYSNAYQQLHGEVDSTILKAIDRQVMSESEPMYEGDGQFRLELPQNPHERAGNVPREEFERVLDQYAELVEAELRRVFEFN
jgi:hypothetical protein